MSKFCYRDGLEIVEEGGSYEVRQFTKFGKMCFYFHAGCLKLWVNEQ